MQRVPQGGRAIKIMIKSRAKKQHQKNPFLSAVDEISFYPYPAMSHCLDMLKGLFEGPCQVVLVLGDFGSGKTLMMKQFLAEAARLWKPCKINPREMEGGQTIGRDKPQREFKAFHFKTPEKTSLMMDDAHHLDTDEILSLIRLTGLAMGDRQMDKLFFFAESEILPAFDELGELIPEDALEKIFMPRLSRIEMETYILKRLDSVKFSDGNLFTESELDWIFDESGGFPGGINETAARLFAQKTKETRKLSLFLKNFF
jgi:type II secretory pathway predicted ATPase ExeA